MYYFSQSWRQNASKMQKKRSLCCNKIYHSKTNFCLFLDQEGENIAETIKAYEAKVQQLERDLFFYKKTSRDLKKKLKDVVGEATYHPKQSKCMNIRATILI